MFLKTYKNPNYLKKESKLYYEVHFEYQNEQINDLMFHEQITKQSPYDR